MKPLDDLVAAITHCQIDVRKLLEWVSNSLDPHEVAVWCEANARWYACRARAALARAGAALFPPRGRPPIPTAAVPGDGDDGADAAVIDRLNHQPMETAHE